MKTIRILSVAAAMSAASLSAYAGPFSYLDFGYGVTNPEHSSKGNYTTLSGSIELQQPLFIGLETTNYKDSGAYDIDVRGVGLGVYAPLGAYANIFGALHLIQTDYNNSTSNDSGYRLTAGLRGMATPRVELEAKMKYEDVYRDTSTKFAAAARLYVTPNFSVAANYDQADINGQDFNSMFASARLTF